MKQLRIAIDRIINLHYNGGKNEGYHQLFNFVGIDLLDFFQKHSPIHSPPFDTPYICNYFDCAMYKPLYNLRMYEIKKLIE